MDAHLTESFGHTSESPQICLSIYWGWVEQQSIPPDDSLKHKLLSRLRIGRMNTLWQRLV